MSIKPQFYYTHDVHLFNITCKEKETSPFESADSFSLLRISDNVYKLYDDQTQKSYEITRELVCLSMIANLFNQTFFNFDSKLNNQQQPQFSEEYEVNFEFHFKQFLIERIFNRNENTSKPNKGREKVKWEENSVGLLLDFLKKGRAKVQKLRRRGIIAKNVRTKLWEDASMMLQNNG